MHTRTGDVPDDKYVDVEVKMQMFRIRTMAVASAMGLSLVAALMSGAPGASAINETTITIHHRLCPTDQVINDYFADCHDGLLEQSFEFTIEHDGGTTVLTTDAGTSEGSANVFAGEVEIYGGVPGEFADTFVYCSQGGAGLDLVNTDRGVRFEAWDGDEIVCDWYNTPIDLSGNGGNGDDDGGSTGGVTQLPNTGNGVSGTTGNESLLLLIAGLGAAGLGSVALRSRRA